MREILRQHQDFKEEKCRIDDDHKHTYFLPKYHCELNPIERVWAQAKRYSKAYCKYSIVSLRNNVVPALESVSLDSIQKHFNKVRHYMFAYLEGLSGGFELEQLVKLYKKRSEIPQKNLRTSVIMSISSVEIVYKYIIISFISLRCIFR